MKNYYKILGVLESSSASEIAEGFRSTFLNAKVLSGEGEEALEAYSVLANPESRRLYDRERDKANVFKEEKRQMIKEWELSQANYTDETKAGQPVVQVDSLSTNMDYETTVKMRLTSSFFFIAGILGLIWLDGIEKLAGIFLLFIGSYILYWYLSLTAPERAAQRQAREEAAQKRAEEIWEEKEIRRGVKIIEDLRAKEAEIAQYQQLRKEIIAMPLYENWRQRVFEKFGRKCAISEHCPPDGLEIHHNYRSFHDIIKRCGTTNAVEAVGCRELWDVENGIPLCKKHHDQTVSSKHYRKNNYL